MSKKNSRRRTRNVLLIVSMMLVVAMASVGGTLAWLTASTGSVTNTFTPSDINITLDEAAGKDNSYQFKMVPGTTITKDPKVTVNKDSEACWLFVKVEKSDNYDTFMNDYTMADDWTALDATTYSGVYYRQVAASTADQTFGILKDNQVSVKNTVTKAQMNGLTATTYYPKLSFTAYAVQQDGITDVATAWAQAQPTPPPAE